MRCCKCRSFTHQPNDWADLRGSSTSIQPTWCSAHSAIRCPTSGLLEFCIDSRPYLLRLERASAWRVCSSNDDVHARWRYKLRSCPAAGFLLRCAPSKRMPTTVRTAPLWRTASRAGWGNCQVFSQKWLSGSYLERIRRRSASFETGLIFPTRQSLAH